MKFFRNNEKLIKLTGDYRGQSFRPLFVRSSDLNETLLDDILSD